jgi:hypothetical protein
MAGNFWDHARRIVFEQGATFFNGPDWHCACADTEDLKVSPSSVQADFGLSPVLVEVEHPAPDPLVFLLPHTFGRLLDIAIQEDELSVEKLCRDSDHLHEESRAALYEEYRSVVYTASAAIHHCKRMGESYSQAVCRFSSQHEDLKRGLMCGQTELFFEFDALISAVMRTLDSLRRPLWRRHGGSGSCPSSFRRTVDNCRELPSQVQQMINDSWSKLFAAAKEHRDCIHHYVAPGAHRDFGRMHLREPGFWTMAVWLLDNPGARSPRQFTFDDRVDALTYAWKLTDGAIKLCKAVYSQNASMS